MLQISLSDSNVPNIEYNVNAVQALTAAYVLYPDNQQKRLQSYSELFGDKYNHTNWIVTDECSCTVFYYPAEPSYIDLKVTDSNSTTIIKIFTLDLTSNHTNRSHLGLNMEKIK